MTKLKGLMAHIFLKNEQAVSGFDNLELFGDGNAFRLAKFYEHRGADALIIFDLDDFNGSMMNMDTNMGMRYFKIQQTD